MPEYYVIGAKAEHLWPVAMNMRRADREEVWASGRRTPLEALRISLNMSQKAWTAMAGDVPFAMFGVAPSLFVPWLGVPWMLATPTIEAARIPFLRQSRHFVDEMQSDFRVLENYVSAENTVSLKWLKFCGFNIGSEYELNGHIFYKFWREKCANQQP